MILKKRKESEDPSVYLAKKEYDKAIKLLRERVNKQPRNSILRLTLGDALLASGKINEAIEEYKELASLYSKDGFVLREIAIYKRILRLKPGLREIEDKLRHLSAKTTPAKIATTAHRKKSANTRPNWTVFQELTEQEFQELISRLTLQHYEEETMILAEGDPGHSLYVIVNGEVRVLTRQSSGKQIVLATLKEGDFFGEVSMLTGRPRTASIITNTPSDVLELTMRDYEYLIQKHPHVKQVLTRSQQQRARETATALIKAAKNRT